MVVSWWILSRTARKHANDSRIKMTCTNPFSCWFCLTSAANLIRIVINETRKINYTIKKKSSMWISFDLLRWFESVIRKRINMLTSLLRLFSSSWLENALTYNPTFRHFTHSATVWSTDLRPFVERVQYICQLREISNSMIAMSHDTIRPAATYHLIMSWLVLCKRRRLRKVWPTRFAAFFFFTSTSISLPFQALSRRKESPWSWKE